MTNAKPPDGPAVDPPDGRGPRRRLEAEIRHVKRGAAGKIDPHYGENRLALLAAGKPVVCWGFECDLRPPHHASRVRLEPDGRIIQLDAEGGPMPIPDTGSDIGGDSEDLDRPTAHEAWWPPADYSG
jgi:hypothetical protein